MGETRLDRGRAPSYPGTVGDGEQPGDLRVELKTLRARVEEQTALQKRAADAIRRLAESLVARKRGYEKLLSLNSFAAYALFTLLLGGGFYLLYQSRVGDLIDAEREATAERDSAKERAAALTEELEAARAASKEAHGFFELMDAAEPARLVSAYSELDTGALTPTERELFAAAAGEARAEVAGERAAAGVEAFDAGDYAEAARALEAALDQQTRSDRTALVQYYLGRSYLELESPKDAARALELSLVGGIADRGVNDARYYFAEALAALGEGDRAARVYADYAERHPTSPRAQDAEERAEELGASE